ncbi:MAG: histidinol-phosphate transaminase [Gammaproteobacteria bacterium]|nr:histidinol-phosphate transaminase [Gammaproteobacteria bacterium]
MSRVTDLARPEIRNMRPYQAAQYADGLTRLNANETPWHPPGDDSVRGLNRYPEIRPDDLTAALASYYGLAADQLIVTRGSSEAIDLLIRCFCRPGDDDVVICPPTFGMYEVYAQVQGAGIVSVPLAADYSLDMTALKNAWTERCKLLFICSPNNPTGNLIPLQQIKQACELTAGNGLVVLDAAYIEFADSDPTLELLKQYDNLVVLRTLSKALGLAGIRCGAALGQADVIALLGCILPPYAYPTPCGEAALAGLAEPNGLVRRIETLCTERNRVSEALIKLDSVVKVWPSDANFVMTEVTNPEQFCSAVAAGGFLIRDFSSSQFTKNCVRITIGEPQQNDQLLAALSNTPDSINPESTD